MKLKKTTHLNKIDQQNQSHVKNYNHINEKGKVSQCAHWKIEATEWRTRGVILFMNRGTVDYAILASAPTGNSGRSWQR